MGNGKIQVSVDDGTATLWCLAGEHGTLKKSLMVIPHAYATEGAIKAGITYLEQGGLAGKYAPARVDFGPDDFSSEEEYQAWLKAGDVPEEKQCPQCEGQGKTTAVTGYVTGEMARDAGEPEMAGTLLETEETCPVCHGDCIVPATRKAGADGDLFGNEFFGKIKEVLNIHTAKIRAIYDQREMALRTDLKATAAAGVEAFEKLNEEREKGVK